MVPTDTLRYAIDQIETSTLIDPHFEPTSNRRYYETFEGLTALRADGSAAPALAHRWEQIDPERGRFHLRPTARFHDGSPVTAGDVVFSFQRAKTPKKSFTVAGRLGPIQRVDPVDAHTVDVVTDRPDPLLPTRLAELMILSHRHNDGSVPVGSGPYRLNTYDPAQVVRLERWDDHDSRHPEYSRVEILPTAANERAAALCAGDLDIAMIGPADRVGLEDAGFRVLTSPATANTGYFLDTVHPEWPTFDPRVRQAINYAVDATRIIHDVFGGVGTVTPGQFAPVGCFGHNPAISAFPYDPDRARSLLREAGFGDGIHITIDAVGYSAHDLPKAQRVAEDLAAIGITSDIALISDLETSLQRWFGNLPRGHLSPTSLAVAPPMDVEYALLWFDRDHPTRHHASEAFDAVHRPSQTALDPARRLSLLQEAATLLHNDPPFLWICSELSVYAVPPALGGFRPRTDATVVPDDL